MQTAIATRKTLLIQFMTPYTINVLNVTNRREIINYVPRHFHTTRFKYESSLHLRAIRYWISNNLKNRFCVTITYTVDNSNRVIETVVVGFEDITELTTFLFSCPNL